MPDLFIPPWLPANPSVLCIGQSPGIEEYRQGRPFIGPAGQEARSWFQAVGADPDEDVAWDNIIQDFHPGEHNYKPTIPEIKASLPRIEAEDYGPVKVAILFGEPAIRLCMRVDFGVGHMMGLSAPMIRGQGRLRDLTTIPAWACYHPSYVANYIHGHEQARIRAKCIKLIEQIWLYSQGEKPKDLLFGRGVYATAT